MSEQRVCRYCNRPFGNHAEDCAVKFRDTTNPDPKVQEWHEDLDMKYELTDDYLTAEQT